MCHVQLPILKLSRKPRANRAVYVPPIIVEEVERDSAPLPEKHVENDASRRVPRGIITGYHGRFKP
jgi:hypothetical protein